MRKVIPLSSIDDVALFREAREEDIREELYTTYSKINNLYRYPLEADIFDTSSESTFINDAHFVNYGLGSYAECAPALALDFALNAADSITDCERSSFMVTMHILRLNLNSDEDFDSIFKGIGFRVTSTLGVASKGQTGLPRFYNRELYSVIEDLTVDSYSSLEVGDLIYMQRGRGEPNRFDRGQYAHVYKRGNTLEDLLFIGFSPNSIGLKSFTDWNNSIFSGDLKGLLGTKSSICVRRIKNLYKVDQ